MSTAGWVAAGVVLLFKKEALLIAWEVVVECEGGSRLSLPRAGSLPPPSLSTEIGFVRDNGYLECCQPISGTKVESYKGLIGKRFR